MTRILVILLALSGCIEPPETTEPVEVPVSPLVIHSTGKADAPEAASRPALCPILDDSGAQVPCGPDDGCLCRDVPESRAWPAGLYCVEVCS